MSRVENTVNKIDVHVHVALSEKQFAPNVLSSSANEMIEYMRNLGIVKSILLPSGERENPLLSNEECKNTARKYPEHFAWMCNVDEEAMEPVEQRLATYKKQGAVGVGEFAIHKRIDDPFVQSVFQAAEALKLPLLFHMCPTIEEGYGIVDDPGLPMLEASLKRYPNLKIVGHSQPFWHEISADAKPDTASRNEWGKGPVVGEGRLVYLLRNYPNLYADLSANSGGCAIMRDEEFGLQFLEEFQDKLMFGTDMVNVQMDFPLGAWLDKQWNDGKLSDATYQKICFSNAKQLFNL